MKLGTYYRHAKGNIYVVLGEAIHTETQERLVIYQRMGKDKLWARPRSMWHNWVAFQGKRVRRFTKITPSRPGVPATPR